MGTEAGKVTEEVVTGKLTAVHPAEIVTLEGTAATPGSPEVSAITAPLAGAGWRSVNVPVAEAPPATGSGLTAIETISDGCSFNVPVAIIPAKDAEIVAEAGDSTRSVVTGKLAVVAPAAIRTVNGALA